MYETIVTHYYPDIDAILGAWLLKRYGHECYPGVADADIQLAPAGILPPDLQGSGDKKIIAVDTGLLDFDTHGRQSLEKSAAFLIAKTLGIDQDPALQPLLTFVEANEATGESLALGDFFAQNLLWPSLIKSIHLYKRWDKPEIFSDLFALLDAAVAFDSFSPHEVAKFWKITDREEDNGPLKALVEVWWQQHRFELPAPFSQVNLQHLLESENENQKPLCHTLKELLNNRRLLEFLYNREKYNLIYIKNSLIGSLVAFAVNRVPLGEIYRILAPFIHGMVLNDLEWVRVSGEVQEGNCLTVYPFRTKKEKKYNIVILEHASPLAGKVIRHRIKHTAILLTINPLLQAVSVVLSRLGPLQKVQLYRLAALFRRAEGRARNLPGKWPAQERRSFQAGDYLGWYLHDSGRLLMHGSWKSPPDQATRLTKSQLVNLVAVFLDEDVPISPSLGCPGLSCLEDACAFYHLNLYICGQIRKASVNPLARPLVTYKIEQAKGRGVH